MRRNFFLNDNQFKQKFSLSAPTSAHRTANESTIAEHALSTNLADLFGMIDESNSVKNNSKPQQPPNPGKKTLNDAVADALLLESSEYYHSHGAIDAESLPPLSARSSHMSYASKKSSKISERSGSIWEASTFYSRAQTAATVYHTKSGKPFLPSLVVDENELSLPLIESDLNVPPKDNLCVLDADDPHLEYKLMNAAVHGVCVYLKNSQRYAFGSRLAEILVERDFLVDSSSNKEYLRFGEEEIVISPAFKLILQVSGPLSLNYGAKNNHLFSRLTSQANPANFVVDFSFSKRYIAKDMLKTVMDFEKPGYLNQTVLADKILVESEFNLFNRQVKYYNKMDIFPSNFKKRDLIDDLLEIRK